MSGAVSDAAPNEASNDWILKSSGLKGSHNIVWPDEFDSTSTPRLTTGLNHMGRAINDDRQEWKHLGLVILRSIASF